MATTYSFAGSVNLTASLKATAASDQTGSFTAAISKLITFAASGGDATLTGYFYGVATCAAGNWLLAHATDPLGSMGDATYCPGFTVAGSKLKFLYLENTDASNSITISRKTTNGLPIFDTADDSITLAPGDVWMMFKKSGTAALTTTSNDGLTVAVSAGSPTCKVLAGYGS